MKPQTAGANVVQRPALELFWIRGNPRIAKNDFQPLRGLRLRISEQTPARDFDGQARTSFVRVTDHVREGLVNGPHYRARIRFLEMHDFRSSLQGCAHQAKSVRIALERQT